MICRVRVRIPTLRRCPRYGWVPPNYWGTETDSNDVGTAFGFATEISPGAAPLTLDSMKKTVAKDALWDGGPTADWDYHCGASTGAFGSLQHFSPGISNRYGNGTSAADYLAKAQLEAYESHRAMFEAYSRNKTNPGPQSFKRSAKGSFQMYPFLANLIFAF